MKKLRTLFFLAFMSLATFSGFSQGLMNQSVPRGSGWLTGQLPDNLRFSLEAGTSFSSFSSGTSMSGNYIAPHLEYQLNPSFTVIAGGSFSFDRYHNLPQPLVMNRNNNNVSPGQQGLSGYSMFVSGRYMINDNLFMTGTVYSDQGQIPLSLASPQVLGYNSKGMSMGIEYRISDNLHFGAEVGVNSSNNPYQFYSPFADPFRNRHNRSRFNSFPY